MFYSLDEATKSTPALRTGESPGIGGGGLGGRGCCKLGEEMKRTVNKRPRVFLCASVKRIRTNSGTLTVPPSGQRGVGDDAATRSFNGQRTVFALLMKFHFRFAVSESGARGRAAASSRQPPDCAQTRALAYLLVLCHGGKTTRGNHSALNDSFFRDSFPIVRSARCPLDRTGRALLYSAASRYILVFMVRLSRNLKKKLQL